jgi:hypothetical protein
LRAVVEDVGVAVVLGHGLFKVVGCFGAFALVLSVI